MRFTPSGLPSCNGTFSWPVAFEAHRVGLRFTRPSPPLHSTLLFNLPLIVVIVTGLGDWNSLLSVPIKCRFVFIPSIGPLLYHLPIYSKVALLCNLSGGLLSVGLGDDLVGKVFSHRGQLARRREARKGTGHVRNEPMQQKVASKQSPYASQDPH